MDGRHARADGSIVLQAKHYHGSGFATLKSRMIKGAAVDRPAGGDAVHLGDLCAAHAEKQGYVSSAHRSVAANARRHFRTRRPQRATAQISGDRESSSKAWAQSTTILETVVTEAVGKALVKDWGDPLGS